MNRIDQNSITIQPAEPDQAGLLLQMIRELADYEKLLHQVTASEADIRRTLFANDRRAEPLIVTADGKPAGFAVFFHNYSTFLGKNGLYLEDVYVRPEFRHRGVGGAILKYLAGVARERDCGRFEWAVLDWNEPAIRFYRSLSAEPQVDWTVYRLEQEGIAKLAGQGEP